MKATPSGAAGCARRRMAQTLMPKARARCVSAAPIWPKPRMPSVLPLSSGHSAGGATPTAHWLSHSPARSFCSRRRNERDSAIIAPITYSAIPVSWPKALARASPGQSWVRSTRSRPAPGTCSRRKRAPAAAISLLKPMETKTSASPSCGRMETSSPLTISQAMLRRRLTGSANCTANDPAKAAFMIFVLRRCSHHWNAASRDYRRAKRSQQLRAG
jgi:hypothetical protein